MTNILKNNKLDKGRRWLMLATMVLTMVPHSQPVYAADASSTAYTTSTDNVLFRDLKEATNTVLDLFRSHADQASDNQAFTIPEKKPALATLKVDMTAYTSTPEECDDSPFVTADGSMVADGIVATNILPFGTKIRIPKYFGDKVFEVHDRMNARYSYRVDIWMNDKKAMQNWGLKQNVTIEVVEYGDGKTQWAKWTKKRLADQQAK